MAQRNAIQGARLAFILNGREVGWAVSVNVRRPSQNVAVEVIGEIDPLEIVPVGRRYMLDCQTVQILQEGVEALGIFGNTTADVINAPGLSAQVLDKITDQVLYEFEGLRIADNNIQISARDLNRENLSFEGTRSRRVTSSV